MLHDQEPGERVFLEFIPGARLAAAARLARSDTFILNWPRLESEPELRIAGHHTRCPLPWPFISPAVDPNHS